MSREKELRYHRGVDREQGRGFGALAEVFGRPAVPFHRKYIVPAAGRIGADTLEFAVPEIADVVSAKKNINYSAKHVGRQSLRKQLGGDAGKRSPRSANPPKTTRGSCSRSRKDIFSNVAI